MFPGIRASRQIVGGPIWAEHRSLETRTDWLTELCNAVQNSSVIRKCPLVRLP